MVYLCGLTHHSSSSTSSSSPSSIHSDAGGTTAPYQVLARISGLRFQQKIIRMLLIITMFIMRLMFRILMKSMLIGLGMITISHQAIKCAWYHYNDFEISQANGEGEAFAHIFAFVPEQRSLQVMTCDDCFQNYFIDICLFLKVFYWYLSVFKSILLTFVCFQNYFIDICLFWKIFHCHLSVFKMISLTDEDQAKNR